MFSISDREGNIYDVFEAWQQIKASPRSTRTVQQVNLREIVPTSGLYDNESAVSAGPTQLYHIMPRNLYSPKLSDDVVRALYQEGLRRRQPMTVVADSQLRQSLGRIANDPPLLRVCEDPPEYGNVIHNPDAA